MNISPRIGLSGFFTPLCDHQLVLVGIADTSEGVRRFDVPAAQIEFCHGHKSLHGVFDLGDGEHSLGMSHEAASTVSILLCSYTQADSTHFVMRSSIDRGSRMKVGSVTRLRSAPGRSCDMMCVSTVVYHVSHCLILVLVHTVDILFP